MTLDSRTDLTAASCIPILDGYDDPESSNSRPAKRVRTSYIQGATIDTSDDLCVPEPDEASTSFDETPGERNWQGGGLTSSLPRVKDSEGTYTATTANSIEEPGTKLYTSSLYTDAFNLALDTVLAEESHLFSEQEAEIFQRYRSLPYEAQYLYFIFSLGLSVKVAYRYPRYCMRT